MPPHEYYNFTPRYCVPVTWARMTSIFRSMFEITGLQILNLFTTDLDKLENRETEREQETEREGGRERRRGEEPSTATSGSLAAPPFPLTDNGSTTVTTTWSLTQARPHSGHAHLTSCSSADWPASPGPRTGRPRWWRRWLGCTSCGGVGSAGPACPLSRPRSWRWADPGRRREERRGGRR